MPFKATIQSITPVTHDVHHYKTDKPEDYGFKPGQATEVSIAKDKWQDEKRPFTFTSLPEDEFLEFTIKSYPERNGVTDKLRSLVVGDDLLVGDPWGAIEYKGPGVFIAGGAGVTPFIAILRNIQQQAQVPHNKLFFANKTENDIILQDELEAIPGLNVSHILSDANLTQYDHGLIDKSYLKEHISDFSQNFYICGPRPMQDQVMEALKELGANPDGLTFEK